MPNANCSPNSIEVGNTLRKLRMLKNFKQPVFAALIGICPEALSKIENGKTDISLSRLGSIAKALDINIKVLLTDPSDLFK